LLDEPIPEGFLFTAERSVSWSAKLVAPQQASRHRVRSGAAAVAPLSTWEEE
jgi:hypothetical protein